MRTITSLAVGFWLGRQIYLRYDKEEALKKERQAKERLLRLLATRRKATTAGMAIGAPVTLKKQ